IIGDTINGAITTADNIVGRIGII
uniref:Septenin 2c n=1 Tax=Osteopilus septentrionalis TaxID=317373 RepID=SEP2C_OSTSE|nr:RecName: Full=Septenin 2c [Osteopilus septentrionalis]